MTVRAKSLVTLSLTASLVSCATLPVFASDNKTDDEKVTIRVAWWGNQTRNDLTVKALDLYTEQHPNVTFETEPSSWDGFKRIPERIINADKTAHARQKGSVIFLFASDRIAFRNIYAPATITNNLSTSPTAILLFLSYCSYLSNTFGDGQSPFFFFSKCPLQNIWISRCFSIH